MRELEKEFKPKFERMWTTDLKGYIARSEELMEGKPMADIALFTLRGKHADMDMPGLKDKAAQLCAIAKQVLADREAAIAKEYSEAKEVFQRDHADETEERLMAAYTTCAEEVASDKFLVEAIIDMMKRGHLLPPEEVRIMAHTTMQLIEEMFAARGKKILPVTVGDREGFEVVDNETH